MTRVQLLFFLCCLSLMPRTSNAEILGPEACPALFSQVSNNQHHTTLRDVIQSEEIVTIIHRTKEWAAPKPAQIPGLELREIGLSLDKQAVAVVRVANTQCPAAEYVLAAGDTIGQSVQILAVLHDGLLMEAEGALYVWLKNEAATPRWNLVWQASWPITPYVDPAKIQSSASARVTPTARVATPANTPASIPMRASPQNSL